MARRPSHARIRHRTLRHLRVFVARHTAELFGRSWPHAARHRRAPRCGATVRQFFATGELHHAHIEHYPGVVFWVFAASSLLSFLRGLGSGLVTSHVTLLPVESFAQAARLANIWIAAATVVITGLVGLRLAGTAVGLLGALLWPSCPSPSKRRSWSAMTPAWCSPSRPRSMRP